MLLFGQRTSTNGSDIDFDDAGQVELPGSEGYFSTIEDRGIIVQNAKLTLWTALLSSMI